MVVAVLDARYLGSHMRNSPRIDVRLWGIEGGGGPRAIVLVGRHLAVAGRTGVLRWRTLRPR